MSNSGAGTIGTVNSTIGYELDFTNLDADGRLGTGPFTVGMYVHGQSLFASTAAIYFDCNSLAVGRSNYCWHNGIQITPGVDGHNIEDAAVLDQSNANASFVSRGNHFVGFSTADTDANLSYAALHRAGQPICWNTLAGCMRWDKGASGLIYANSNTGAAIFTFADDGSLTSTNLTAKNGLTAKTINSPLYTPPSSSSACRVGDHSADANYVYICMARNTWKRAALSSW